VFAQLGKGGDVAASDLEAICRVVSMYLRVNGSMDDVISQLDGIGSSLSIPTKDGRVTSLADGLARAMVKYKHAKEMAGLESLLLGKVDLSSLSKGLKSMGPVTDNGDQSTAGGAFKVKCPECSSNLTFAEGCVVCHSCRYSKC
jgi:ribonucleoside-diphosphate reductase alpha chain